MNILRSQPARKAAPVSQNCHPGVVSSPDSQKATISMCHLQGDLAKLSGFSDALSLAQLINSSIPAVICALNWIFVEDRLTEQRLYKFYLPVI
jgi:hypothetical protein